ncbi:MAG: four helix bundle protein [Candidatus Peribacteraceae bacterium]|jgi:four helix bundle protein
MYFKTFEEIEVWQAARLLMRKVRIFTRRAMEKKDWGWADQVTRSTLSIMANIAEGNDAQTNVEFIMYLGYAKRSGAETRSHLYYGLDEGYVLKEEFEDTIQLCRKITAQLGKLIQYLQQHRAAKHRGVSS